MEENQSLVKYLNTEVVFQEIPYEICLAINITNCPNRCKGCHSPYLQQDIGEILRPESLDILIAKNKGITCVLFMGGDANPNRIAELSQYVQEKFKLKTAWYSGSEKLPDTFAFNYIKIGPYKEEFGPLNKRTTNQRLYKKEEDGNIVDVTNVFWNDSEVSI